ncbi:MAG: hypothetical protein QNK05_20255 [Myxococcota bacterium]|nr:hypothetical protein [Myxococcota bacterium]
MPLDPPTVPLVSTRAEEADLEEAIDEFVVGLGERVDALQDAEAGGDLEDLSKRAFDLVERSRTLGYGPMCDAAQELLRACESPPGDAVHKAVADITEIAKRIRRGHRTAA